LSVEDDVVTADPPMNDAVDRRASFFQNRIAVPPASAGVVFKRLVG
jgi:hypothetical protein